MALRELMYGGEEMKTAAFGKTRLCMDPSNEVYELRNEELYAIPVMEGEDWIIEKEGVTGTVSDHGDPPESEDYTFWYIDGEFVECASLEIDMDYFERLGGSEKLIEEAVQNLGYDNDIDSILLCSDDHIYVNMEGERNLYLILKKTGNTVEYENIGSWRYLRRNRVTPHKPYYPVLDNEEE